MSDFLEYDYEIYNFAGDNATLQMHFFLLNYHEKETVNQIGNKRMFGKRYKIKQN